MEHIRSLVLELSEKLRCAVTIGTASYKEGISFYVSNADESLYLDDNGNSLMPSCHHDVSMGEANQLVDKLRNATYSKKAKIDILQSRKNELLEEILEIENKIDNLVSN